MKRFFTVILFMALYVFQARGQDSSFVKKVYKEFYNRFLQKDFSPSDPDSARGIRPGLKRIYSRLYKKYVYVDSTLIDRDSSRGFSSNPIAVPVVGFSQERKLEIGLAMIYSFYRNRIDVKALGTSLYINAGLFHLEEVRYRLKPVVWGKNREFRFQQLFDYQRYNTNFYGIGNHTLKADVSRYSYLQLNSVGEIQKRVSDKMYLGVSAGLQYVRLRDISRKHMLDSLPGLVNRKGTTLFQLGPTLNFDTRDFQNFADRGDYIRASMLFSPRFLNRASGHLLSYFLDLRHYAHLSNQQVLCMNLVSSGFLNNIVPFVFLSQLGGNQIMRGYYLGRFRDKRMTAIQAEYRYRIIPRLALALFTGTGEVYGYEPFSLKNLKPDFGGGIRYIFDLPSRSTLRLDYAIGEKIKGEPRIKGFYISINEAF